MKHLRETFTDEEFAELLKTKKVSKLNWHDFIMLLTKLSEVNIYELSNA